MTKERIIEATIQNISLYGYEGTTMKKIAEDSDIKSASIYYFFQNKEELFLNVLDQVLNNHFEAMSTKYYTNEENKIINILENLLKKIASHHYEYKIETNVYLRLMESSNLVLKEKVVSYLDSYNNWLYEQLYTSIKQSDFHLEEQDIKRILNMFLLIGNGIFWGNIIYSKEKMKVEIQDAQFLMRTIYKEIGGWR